MRIGLGVVAGENDVTFVLRGAGVHLLDEDTDDLVDGDDIAQVPGEPQVARHPVPRRDQALCRPRRTGTPAGHPVVPVTRDEIAALVRRGRRFLVF